jgi:hypothetical protein
VRERVYHVYILDADYSARFSNPSDGQTTTGLAHLDTSQRVTSQAFTVSINKVF